MHISHGTLSLWPAQQRPFLHIAFHHISLYYHFISLTLISYNRKIGDCLTLLCSLSGLLFDWPTLVLINSCLVQEQYKTFMLSTCSIFEQHSIQYVIKWEYRSIMTQLESMLLSCCCTSFKPGFFSPRCHHRGYK